MPSIERNSSQPQSWSTTSRANIMPNSSRLAQYQAFSSRPCTVGHWYYSDKPNGSVRRQGAVWSDILRQALKPYERNAETWEERTQRQVRDRQDAIKWLLEEEGGWQSTDVAQKDGIGIIGWQVDYCWLGRTVRTTKGTVLLHPHIREMG